MEDHGSFSDLDKPGAMEGGLRELVGRVLPK
jgi:hypothetical protein